MISVAQSNDVRNARHGLRREEAYRLVNERRQYVDGHDDLSDNDPYQLIVRFGDGLFCKQDKPSARPDNLYFRNSLNEIVCDWNRFDQRRQTRRNYFHNWPLPTAAAQRGGQHILEKFQGKQVPKSDASHLVAGSRRYYSPYFLSLLAHPYRGQETHAVKLHCGQTEVPSLAASYVLSQSPAVSSRSPITPIKNAMSPKVSISGDLSRSAVLNFQN